MEGIQAEGNVPPMHDRAWQRSLLNDEGAEPLFQPGWYAVDREHLLQRSGGYDYLQQFEPVAWAGYGFQIFEISSEQAEELEQQWRKKADSDGG